MQKQVGDTTKIKDFTISNVAGKQCIRAQYQVTGELPVEVLQFMLQHKDKTFVVTLGSGQRNFEKNRPIFDSIISSFQFDATPTTSTRPSTTTGIRPSPSTGQSAGRAQQTAVSATDLMRAYKENKIAADAKYKGKRFVVQGTIIDFGSINAGPYVALEAGEMIADVRCIFLSRDTSSLSSLRKGQSIRIEGIGDGELMGFVSLKNCSIVGASL